MNEPNSQFKNYFLGNLTAEEGDKIELQLYSDKEFAEQLGLAENDLIEEYLDDELSPTELILFEKNYLTCEVRLKKVHFLKALKSYAKAQNATLTETKPGFFERLKTTFGLRPLTLGFGTLALVCAIGIVGFYAWKSTTNRPEVLVSLNKIYKTERPLSSRIADFDYAPKPEGTRGANDNKENFDLENTKFIARKAVMEKPTAENLHALGQIYLTEKEFDKAIEQFEKAIRQNPNIAKIHNDLGVALLEKAGLKEDGKLENLAKSNEEFAKAAELDGNLLEARFNQALCIQALNLPNQAKEAWENYLKLDSTSKWADEARKNLEMIDTQKSIGKTKEMLMQDFLTAQQQNDEETAWKLFSENREMSSGKLIPYQLAFFFINEKALGNTEQASDHLKLLNYIGELDAEKSGDLFWRDASKFYSNLSESEILPQKKALDEMSEAAALRTAGKIDDAILKYEAAKKSLIETQNIWFSKLCEYWLASLKFRINRVKLSNDILEELVKYGTENNYKWLVTHSLVHLTYGLGSQNKTSKTILYGERALKLALQTNDLYNTQRIYTSLAFDYKTVGQFGLSFKYLEKTLEIINKTNITSPQRWAAFENLTFTLFEKKYFQTAVVIQKEALKLAEGDADMFARHLSNLYLGMLYTELQEYAEAEIYLTRSRDSASAFSDEQAKLKGLAFIDLQTARLKRKTENFDQAVSYFKAANRFYTASEFKSFGYEALKGELLCNFSSRNDAGFNETLPFVIDYFNKYRTEISEEKNRTIFFAQEQNVYDIAVDYEFSKSNFAAAFDYSEESRARSLLDLQNSEIRISTDDNQPEIKFSASPVVPFKLSQIQAQMPAETHILEYSVLTDKVLIWLISNQNVIVAKTDIRAENLREKVSRYRELLSKNIEPNEQLVLAKELHGILIDPVKNNLEQNANIFIIPDKMLTQLAFETLFNDRYLIEDYKISYSPSANVFLNCSRKAEKVNNGKPETLLSIGNPTFNQAEYENELRSLFSAKIEAEKIAENYQNPIVLTETEATKAGFKEHLKTADVVHFAGHYAVDESSPLLSSFILAGKTKDESNLANFEIFGEKLAHLRLIVLSACDTGAENYYDGEGMIGASRTFLATGVPLVVASQWNVDSEATKELMIGFHKFRKLRQLSTAESLRLAKLEMMKDEKFKQPYYWSAFAAIGGFTRF